MTSGLSAGQLIAALLVPPLALFFAEGMSRNFWISVVLTCLGWIPGVVFTLFVLLKGSAAAGRPA